jgi:hypothetical protein
MRTSIRSEIRGFAVCCRRLSELAAAPDLERLNTDWKNWVR